MREKILDVQDFKVSFYQDQGKLQVVRGIDLLLRKGEMIGIVGESGSGKSVTVSSLIKLQDESISTIDQGSVLFEGENLVNLSEKKLASIRGKRIAYIFQNPSQALNPYKRIGKQLESVLKTHRQPYSYPLICEALKEVGIDSPDTVYNMYPFQLSGGQNQRIMIALCILSKPDILIADEPTSSIDASLRKRILDLLIKVNKKYQMSIILITHDFDVAKYLCERIHIMFGGRIVEEGQLKDVFKKPLHPYTQELIKCASSLDLGDDNFYSLEGSPLAMDSILKVENLSKHFIIKSSTFSKKEIIHAVKNVTFELKNGQSIGLIGESGSGKSTMANLLLKLLEPSSGKIHLFGQDITYISESEMRKHRRDIQIIFQYTNAVLDPKMTVSELLLEPLRIHKIVEKSELDSEVDRLLTLVGLKTSEKNKFPSQLSGGQNQRVIIARAIATRAKIIICDEPVSALDVSVQGQILNLLSKLKDELKLSYIFISHDLKVVAHMCDQIAVMYKGEFVEFGKTHDVLYHSEHDYTKKLLEAIL